MESNKCKRLIWPELLFWPTRKRGLWKLFVSTDFPILFSTSSSVYSVCTSILSSSLSLFLSSFLSVHLFVYLCPSVPPYIQPSFIQFVHSVVWLSVHLSSVCPFFCSSIHPFFHLAVPLIVHYLSILSLVHLFPSNQRLCYFRIYVEGPTSVVNP